jgi:uncharacterized repeat protein (TIGR01451 family)
LTWRERFRYVAYMRCSVVLSLGCYVFFCAVGASPAQARKPKPEPCEAARWVVTTDGAPFTVVQAGPATALEDICEAVDTSKYSANRKGVTHVRAKWAACEGLTGKVRLGARILDDCTRLEGKVKAKRFKLTFDAVKSVCGDEFIDTGGGEVCDDGNALPGDGCEDDCTATPSTTTTVTTTTTSTTSVESTTSTTIVPGSTTSTLPTTTSSTTPTTSTTSTTLPGTSTSTTLPIPSTTSTTTASTSTSSSTTTLPAPVELSLVMVANPDPVVLGGLVTYGLTVTNPGGVDAEGVVLRMPVPSGLYGSSGCRAVSDDGVLPPACSAGQDVVWSLGTIAAGTSRTVQFVGLVTVSGLPDGSVIAATAHVTDGTLLASDSAQADVVVGTAAPLVLNLDEDRDPVAAGDTLEYVLRFGNRSATPQLTTELVLALPAGVTVVDAGGATLVGDTAVWTLGTVNDGDAGERRLVVQVDDLGAADPLVRVASAEIASVAASARAAVVTQVETVSPLALAVTATPDPVGLGDLLTYSLTVTNRGAAGSAATVLRMRVPEGLYGSSGCNAVSDDGVVPGACAVGRDIEWALGTLAAGASRTVQFVGQMTVSALPDGFLVHANARVENASGARARAEVTTTVATGAALVLALDESADPVSAGETLEYVLRFGNRSANPLLTTALSLTLPPGMTILDDGGATVTGDTAMWSLGTVQDGDAGERRLAVQVNFLGGPDPLVRVARATIASGVVAARAAVVTHVDVATAPPLSLVMTATPDPVGLGGLLEYSLTVTNTGPSDAAGVVARMRVPQGMYGSSGCQAVSDDGTLPGACAAGRDVTWDLGTVVAGTSRTVQFVGLVTVAGLADGSLVRGDARVVDVSGASARATVTTIVASGSALVLTLDDDADPVAAGDTLEYVLRFGNRSASPLLTTSLALTLPPGTTVVDDGGATVTGDVAVWSLGTLGAGVAGERRVTVQVDDLAGADPLVRVARAGLETGALAARAVVVTQVEVDSPLALEVMATPDPVGLGTLLTYELTVTNTGTVASDGVGLRMRVPEGLYGSSGCQAVSDDGVAPGACAAGRDVVWDLGTLAAGASRAVRFVGLVTVSGVADGSLIHASARVVDVAGAAARKAVAVAVDTASALVLTLDEDADPVGFGAPLEYVVRYGNRSAGALATTVLSLTLPPGVTVVDDGGATVTGDTATWSLGTLAAGEAGEQRLSVEIDDLGAADALVRTARAAVESGVVAARAGVVTQVEAGAPLSLSITAAPDPVALGGLLTYTLTITNDGGTAADGVFLRMAVPEGLYGSSGCNSVSDGGVAPGACAAGRDIVWDLGTLAAGASRSVTFVGRVTVSGLPDGYLIHGTARVRDVAGAAARTGVTTSLM